MNKTINNAGITNSIFLEHYKKIWEVILNYKGTNVSNDKTVQLYKEIKVNRLKRWNNDKCKSEYGNENNSILTSMSKYSNAITPGAW